MPDPNFKSAIVTYFAIQKELLDKHIFAAKATMDPEAIHQFRLSIKRIRALFHLLEDVTVGNFNAKQAIRPLRKIFRPAGQLRDIHVQAELIQAYENQFSVRFSAIWEYLILEEQRLIPKAHKRILRYKPVISGEILLIVLSALDSLDSSLLLHNAGKHVIARFQHLKKLRESIADPKVFHEFRAHQKEAFYMLDFINNFTIGSVNLATPIGDVKATARQIGAWHDKHLLIGRIHKIYLKYDSETFRNECIMMTAILTNDINKLFGDLSETLQDDDMYKAFSTR